MRAGFRMGRNGRWLLCNKSKYLGHVTHEVSSAAASRQSLSKHCALTDRHMALVQQLDIESWIRKTTSHA